jgi:aspartate carbamoyltransferase catalytic subunit
MNDQVAAGVAVRMAVLYELLAGDRAERVEVAA